MQYTVQFVGLACFLRSPGERTVLLPDGRDPGQGIDPHFASIVVDHEAIEEATGWNGDADLSRGRFTLPPCSIAIEDADIAGTLDTSGHDHRLPELRKINPKFAIDPATAQTIATLRIRQGTLAAYRVPGGTAVISQLDVPHDGSITISVTPRDHSPTRTIRLKPGTEIAITNTSRGGYAALDEQNGHFHIYEKLSATPAELTEPDEVPDVPASKSQHPMFRRATPIGLSTSCSNTGCCSL